MAKELPYFKFEPSEWDNGNIQMCCLNTRAIFIDLCCIYWIRVGDLPYELALQKICGGNNDALDELDNRGIIKLEDELISIKGKVIYCNAHDFGTFRTGIQFLETNEKILSFVINLLKTYTELLGIK